MATDGPTPAPCDPEIYRDGVTVLITAGLPSNAMERWVRKVAARSGQRVDWYFAAGRAIVNALGDIDAVLAAVEELTPEYEAQVRELESAL